MKRILLLLLLLPLLVNAQIITTVAGGATSGSGDGGPATAAYVPNAQNIALDKYGNLYLSDPLLRTIRKVNTSGIITTVAGPGIAGFPGDGGPATAAYLNTPLGVTCDTAGNLYIADRYAYNVRKVNVATGIISTVAGNGATTFGGSGDGGPATSATFNTVSDLRCDKRGNLYIADNSASAIRKVDPTGKISTFAGMGGTIGFSGDEGPATAAQMKDCRFFCFDEIGNMYIAEQLGRRIRKVDTFGIIHTVGGTGMFAYNGDSIPATTANFTPTGIAAYNHAIYISTADHRIRKIDLNNDTNFIYHIAGTGVGAYNGDGIAADTAKIYNPGGLAMMDCYNIYMADIGNQRVRKIALPPIPTKPTIVLSGAKAFFAGTTVTVTATVSNTAGSYIIHWMNRGIQFATSIVPFITYTKLPGIDSITARIVPTSYGCFDSTTSAKHMVAIPTLVNNVSPGQAFHVYPNPANGILYIAGNNITSLAIHNTLGQAVFTNEYLNSSEVQIDVAKLPPGIYFIKINATEISKFVKQ